jgi:hypothetical protein
MMTDIFRKRKNNLTFFHFLSALFFISVLFSLFLNSGCSNKKQQGSGRGNNGGNGGDNSQCSSKISFYPEKVSGESPLAVTVDVKFEGQNSKGITYVVIDFGADGFDDIDIKDFQESGTKSFSYNLVYSSVGTFKDTFKFWWSEGNRICSKSFTIESSVVFYCPAPQFDIFSLQSVGGGVSITFRILNLPLEKVDFFLGYENLQKVQCNRNPVLQNACDTFILLPGYGDWSICFYAQSWCGRASQLTCTSVLASYGLSNPLVSYYIRNTRRSYLYGATAAFESEPFISLLSYDGELAVKKRFLMGDNMLYSDIGGDGVWALIQSGANFIIKFTSFSGEEKTVISEPNLYGSVAFDVFSLGGKKYLAVLRSFAGGAPGDILVYDVSSYEAHNPICQKKINSGASLIKFINGYLFVKYSQSISAFKINFSADVCDFPSDQPPEFQPGSGLFLDFFDFEWDNQSTYAVGVWSSFEFNYKSKVSLFNFYFVPGGFLNVSSFDVFSGKRVQVLALKVSPQAISRVAIGYRNEEDGGYYIKLYDTFEGKSIGSVEGFQIGFEPRSIVFLSESKVLVFGANLVSLVDFSSSEKKTAVISGISQTAKPVFNKISCDTSEFSILVPDGGSVAELDISPIFKGSGGARPANFFSGVVALLGSGPDGKSYALFQTGSSFYLSDLTRSFQINFEGSDPRTLAIGNNFFLVGGGSGLWFSKKGWSSFLKYPGIPQARRIIYNPSGNYFFVFSGSGIFVLKEKSDSLEGAGFFAVDCQDVVSDGDTNIYCLRSFGIIEYRFDGASFVKQRERAFFLAIGNIIDSQYSNGHIFFVSDLNVSDFAGIINTQSLRIVLLYPLGQFGEEIKALGISSFKYCSLNSFFFSVFGDMPIKDPATGVVLRRDFLRGFQVVY